MMQSLNEPIWRTRSTGSNRILPVFDLATPSQLLIRQPIYLL